MTTSKKLKIQFPSQGWKQFLTARTEMLDSFDRAREKSRAHEVEVFHGRVAEAEFRKWLRQFLPRRFAVTSGYIISAGLNETDNVPHYDVIVYDELESPVLWVEDNPDVSSQGRSKAIPVEHVKAVLEVKSKLNSTTAKDAIEHLQDLQPLMSGNDDSDEKYKLHFSDKFCCGVVFFDLEKDSEFSEAALSNLIDGIGLKGFFGGVILRGEGHSVPMTGRISILQSKSEISSSIGKGKVSLLSGAVRTDSIETGDGSHIATILSWAEHEFSRFAFDLIAMMQGSYKAGMISSFYGLGASGFEDSW